jgi:hypothetical protein
VPATKVGALDRDGDDNLVRADDDRPEHIRRSIDKSLGCLGTDDVDVYYVHRVDPDVPIEESVGALLRAAVSVRRGAGCVRCWAARSRYPTCRGATSAGLTGSPTSSAPWSRVGEPGGRLHQPLQPDDAIGRADLHVYPLNLEGKRWPPSYTPRP